MVLVLSVFNMVGDLNFDETNFENIKIYEIEEDFLEDFSAVSNETQCRVLELKYREYILGEAENLGLNPSEVKVNAEISVEGLYYPNSAEIYGLENSEQREMLRETVMNDLGIPEERLHFVDG